MNVLLLLLDGIFCICLLDSSGLYCCYWLTKSCLTFCNPVDCSMPGFPVLYYHPKFVQTHVHWVGDVMPSNQFLLWQPLLLPSNFPSIRVFSCEWALWIKWPKYWHFSFSISPSNEYSGLISFRIVCFDLLAGQGILTSLLQYHNLKASIHQYSGFFMIQLSHLNITTEKIIALTIWTFVGKVMSQLFNTLSRFVIAFLPRSKYHLISWPQSLSTVILEPKKIKSVTVSIVSPSICHEVMGPDAMIFVFWMLSFKPAFSLSSFTFIKRLFSSFSLSATRLISSVYLRLLISLPAILIPVCDSPS